MGKFKVGDRVRRTLKPYNDVKIGTLGTITEIINNCESARVKVDGRKSEELATWGFDYVELCNPSSVHITVSGNTTIAVLKDGKQVVKRAYAKCSQEDEFDFNIGAEIAFSRLFGKELVSSSIYVGSNLVKCVDNKRNISLYKIGEIYTVENGTVYDKDGKEIINGGFKTAEEFIKWTTAKFELASTTPQVREVKRKAKVGEWVKIVNAMDSFGNYKNGDVLKIISFGNNASAYYGEDPNKCLYSKEYVVLENYVPQTYTQTEVDALIKAEQERTYSEVIKIFKWGFK